MIFKWLNERESVVYVIVFNKCVVPFSYKIVADDRQIISVNDRIAVVKGDTNSMHVIVDFLC